MPGIDDRRFLADHYRRLHRALIDAVLGTGCVPSQSALAGQLDTSPEAIQEGLRSLAAADYLALDAGGQPTCLYPVSATTTAHVVIIDGQPRYAMCAIDALGIPAMLAQEFDILGQCAVCSAPIALSVGPGTILLAIPSEIMVVARRDATEPAFAACCPYTVFVCGQEHADQFMRRIAGTRALSLPDALRHAEEIFGGLLADAMPASRPRGNRWEPARDP